MGRLRRLTDLASYYLALLIFKFVITVFFRETVKRNSHQIPDKGPVIFVAAPHANQFVDPLIILCTSPRRVKFLVAATTLRRTIAGLFGRLIGGIPVERPQDHARKGQGRIWFDPKDSTKRNIVGCGTKFLEQIRIGRPHTSSTASKGDEKHEMSISISCPPENPVMNVERVVDDYHLILAKPLEDRVIERINKEGMVDYKIMPVLDHTKVYSAVFDVLEAGECVGIFPEGGSHDRAEMLPLKAGVCIMALGAMARNPDSKVSIVPCGLTYFNPDKFRSRAIIEYGDPIQIDPHLVELFKAGGESRREACGRLLDQVYYALCGVTLNAPDFETLQAIQAVRRLYQPSSRKLSSFELLEVTRRFVKGVKMTKDDPKIKAILGRVLEYNKLLHNLRLMDHQVKDKPVGRTRAFILLSIQLIRLALYSVLVLPGFILNLPVLIIVDYLSKKKQAEDLAKSSVKVKGRDVVASWKLIISFVLIPTLYTIYTIPVALHLFKMGAGWGRIVLFSALCHFILWILSYAILRIGERGYDVLSSIRLLYLCLVGPRQGQILNEIRSRLRVEIIKAVDEFGPQVFGGTFESDRIVPSRRPSIADVQLNPSPTVAVAEEILSPTAHRAVGSSLLSSVENFTSVDAQQLELEELLDRAKALARSVSPASMIASDGLEFLMSGLEYMKGGMHTMTSAISYRAPGRPSSIIVEASSDFAWSHVDPIEIDDIFFTRASPTPSLIEVNSVQSGKQKTN